MIEIRVDGEPVGKGRPRFVRATGIAHTPEKTASFENKVAWAAQCVMRGRPLLEGPLMIVADFYFTIPASKPAKWRAAALAGLIRPTKKPDFDNLIKSVADALNKVVWVDDGQIVDAKVRKWYGTPRFEIRVDNLSTDGL